MRIAVLGTGMVGQSLAAGFARTGHDVVIGTRDPEATIARRETDAMGAPGFGVWYEQHGELPVVPSATAVDGADVVVNATNGVNSIQALDVVGPELLADKVLLDVANALDFTTTPPGLATVDGPSLAETIQARFPSVRVVKSLNTMNANVMVEPSLVADGDHSVFVCGNDDAAKETVRTLLTQLGWNDVIDLGDLTAAATVEALLPIWLRLMGTLGTPLLQFRIVR
ncbi:MAG: NAD(P)-binding domain-containing protein [Actinomycetota bacterium]